MMKDSTVRIGVAIIVDKKRLQRHPFIIVVVAIIIIIISMLNTLIEIMNDEHGL